MILECACGKMYRVRDDAASPPTTCPKCGGALKQAEGSSANIGADSRVKELQQRVRELEKERDEARERSASLERDLQQARETSKAFAAAAEQPESSRGLADQVNELRAAAGKADKLQREILDLRSETERKLKEKERDLAQAREAQEREAAERRKLETRVSGLEETHARALAEKQKTIEALDASVVSYRGKLDALQKRLDSSEMQRMIDRDAYEAKLRAREQEDRTGLEKVQQAQQKALADLRAELERQIAEKDRQLSEGRQQLDREAAERRRLSEVLSRLQQTADRTVKEKEAAIAALEAGVASYRTKIESLQKRVDNLEQLRRSEADAYATRLRAREGLRARLEEAGHLASDLDHTLDSMDAVLAGLHDRVKRLGASLHQDAEPEPPLPAAALSPAGQAEPFDSAQGKSESAPPPPLSQADAFSDVLPKAGPPEPVAPVREDAEQATEEVEAERVEPEPSFEGRTDAPSEIQMAVSAEPEELVDSAQGKPEAAAEPDTRAGRAAPAAENGPAEAVPLISPPEEDAPLEAAPAGGEEKPEPKKKGLLSKFFGKKK